MDEIHTAFRKQALHCHPDKNQDSAAGEFIHLKDARDRAILLAGNPDVSCNGQEVDPVVSWAVSWMSHMTYEIAKNKRAKTVEVDIDVTLEDVYHGRTKKVVIGVLRADSGDPFKRTRQIVYVKLIYRGDSLDAVFPGMGDDPPLAILMGFKVWKDMVDVESLPPRSDVIVRIHVRDGVFRRDAVLRPYDLHTDVSVTLEGRYLGAKFEIEHPSGTPSVVEYEGGKEEERQVKVIKGMGLPYYTSESNHSRGDAYVFMEPKMPRPEDLDMDSQEVRDALALLANSRKIAP